MRCGALLPFAAARSLCGTQVGQGCRAEGQGVGEEMGCGVGEGQHGMCHGSSRGWQATWPALLLLAGWPVPHALMGWCPPAISPSELETACLPPQVGQPARSAGADQAGGAGAGAGLAALCAAVWGRRRAGGGVRAVCPAFSTLAFGTLARSLPRGCCRMLTSFAAVE